MYFRVCCSLEHVSFVKRLVYFTYNKMCIGYLTCFMIVNLLIQRISDNFGWDLENGVRGEHFEKVRWYNSLPPLTRTLPVIALRTHVVSGWL